MARLTLTFDNGPHPPTTAAVLEALAARRLPATFFVVGDRLQRPGGRAAAEEVRAAGHRIGNHSMHHAVPLGSDPDPVHAVAEIADAEAVIGALAETPPLFRPFGGGGILGPHLLSAAAVHHLTGHGYTVVTWTSVPRDWEEPVGWVDRAVADLAEDDWTVLVLHDLPTGAMDALPGFLDQAIDAGTDIVEGFPDSVLPIIAGECRGDVAAISSS
jgi:peptidoglycan-N-acetylglucosamine deacetylase